MHPNSKLEPPTIWHCDSLMRGPGVIINEGQFGHYSTQLGHYSTQIGHYGIMKVRNDHVSLTNQVEVLIIFISLISQAEVFIILTITIKKMTRYFQCQEDSLVWDRGRWFLDQHFQDIFKKLTSTTGIRPKIKFLSFHGLRAEDYYQYRH